MDTTSARLLRQRECDVEWLNLADREPECGVATPYSNTGGQNTNNCTKLGGSKKQFKAGIDWFSGYCWGQFSDVRHWGLIFERLSSLSGPENDPIPVEFFGYRGFFTNHKTGVGVTRTDYSFNAACGTLYLGFMKPGRCEAGGVPAFQWQFKGQFCGDHDSTRLLAEVNAMADALSVKEHNRELRMTRLDLNLDVLNVETQAVKKLADRDQIICRAKRFTPTSAAMGKDERTETIYFGNPKASPMFLRVYDKRLQLSQPTKLMAARSYWQNNPDWRGEEQGPITRFEFQLNREKLVEYSMGNAMFVPYLLESTIKDLTAKWFRVIQNKDGVRKERQKPLVWWNQAASVWAKTMRHDAERQSPAEVEKDLSKEPLILQASHFVARIAAFHDGDRRAAVRDILQRMEAEDQRFKLKTQEHRLKIWSAK